MCEQVCVKCSKGEKKHLGRLTEGSSSGSVQNVIIGHGVDLMMSYTRRSKHPVGYLIDSVCHSQSMSP
jgi:hypothetical protein